MDLIADLEVRVLSGNSHPIWFRREWRDGEYFGGGSTIISPFKVDDIKINAENCYKIMDKMFLNDTVHNKEASG